MPASFLPYLRGFTGFLWVAFEADCSMSPTQFEQCAAALYQKLLGLGRATVIQQRRLVGRSGATYRPDAAFTIDIPGTSLLVVLECKRKRRPVEVGEVRSFAEAVRDVGASKGILVSSSGFQRGAVLHASNAGIALITLTVGDTEDEGEVFRFRTVLKHRGRDSDDGGPRHDGKRDAEGELGNAMDWATRGIVEIVEGILTGVKCASPSSWRINGAARQIGAAIGPR